MNDDTPEFTLEADEHGFWIMDGVKVLGNMSWKGVAISWLRVISALEERIQELVDENIQLESMISDHIESTGDDPEVMAATRAEWADRARIAEAKLAAVKNSFKDVKELTGGKDD